MKKLTKTLLFAFASLFLTSSLFAATLHEGKASKNTFVLADNHQYSTNFQTQGQDSGFIFPKDYVAKKGDKITIHVEATVNKEIVVGANGKSLEILFVDTTQAANWWLDLTNTEDNEYGVANIKAGELVKINHTFDILEKPIQKVGLHLDAKNLLGAEEIELIIKKAKIDVQSLSKAPNYIIYSKQIKCKVIIF